jgi:hypothetical protein
MSAIAIGRRWSAGSPARTLLVISRCSPYRRGHSCTSSSGPSLWASLRGTSARCSASAASAGRARSWPRLGRGLMTSPTADVNVSVGGGGHPLEHDGRPRSRQGMRLGPADIPVHRHAGCARHSKRTCSPTEPRFAADPTYRGICAMPRRTAALVGRRIGYDSLYAVGGRCLRGGLLDVWSYSSRASDGRI